MEKSLWEILVPTVMIVEGKEKPVRTRYHRVWDKKIREMSGGMTILGPAKGAWHSPDNKLFIERMIPVRFMATFEEVKKIAAMTAKYYNQKAVMYYEISSRVFIDHF